MTNTRYVKNMLAVFSSVTYGIVYRWQRSLNYLFKRGQLLITNLISKDLFILSVISFLFSRWCFISMNTLGSKEYIIRTFANPGITIIFSAYKLTNVSLNSLNLTT